MRIRPITMGALITAVLATLLLWPGTSGPGAPAAPGDDRSPANALGEDAGRTYVQFVYVAPDARSVTVAGDFNGWSEEDFALHDPDGDGVWTGRVALPPGLHKYMLVVDGEWVADPLAERHVDDGFGNRNALITVDRTRSAI